LFDQPGTRAPERTAKAVRAGVHVLGQSPSFGSEIRQSPPGLTLFSLRIGAGAGASDWEGRVRDRISNLVGAGISQPCTPRRITVQSEGEVGVSGKLDTQLANRDDSGRLRA